MHNLVSGDMNVYKKRQSRLVPAVRPAEGVGKLVIFSGCEFRRLSTTLFRAFSPLGRASVCRDTENALIEFNKA
jgi:hypothetical protein